MGYGHLLQAIHKGVMNIQYFELVHLYKCIKISIGKKTILS